MDRASTDYPTRAGHHGTKLIGLGTGAFILARLGLMQGRKCSVGWFNVS
jgi:transcriptional regulator GlxA family with amidase domain